MIHFTSRARFPSTSRSTFQAACRDRGAPGGARALAALTLLPCLALLSILLPACGRSPASSATGSDGAPRLVVVCTVGMIADAAAEIGGDRAKVTALMGEGVDPHLYKASPGDVRGLTEADVVFYGGLHLEGRMGDVLEKLGERAKPKVCAVGEAIPAELLRTPPEFNGHPDPHVWFDVALWMNAVGAVRDTYIAADPAHADEYRARGAAYLAKLKELDDWTRAEIQRIPEDVRILITAHDAFGYFGRAYGLDVRGIQGISTDSEAGLKDINALVDLIVERRVKAVFVESSVPRKMIDALVEGCRGRGHEVKIGGELFSDAMGRSGTPDGTYDGMVRHNVRLIVSALRGETP